MSPDKLDSAELFGVFFAPLPVPCLLLDKDARIVKVNQACASFFGSQPDYYAGVKLKEIADLPKEYVNKSWAGEEFAGIRVGFSGTGKVLGELEATLYPMRDPGGEILGVLLVINPVQQDVIESYGALSEQALVGVYLYDEDRFVYVNEQMVNITGYTVEELMDMSTSHLIAPRDSQRVAEIVKRRKEGKDASPNYSFSIVRKDGREAVLEVYTSRITHRGRPVTVGYCIDVTQSRKSEEEIRERNRELDTLLETSNLVSATLDENEVASIIAEQATRLLGADGCTVYRLDPASEELVPQTTTIEEDREKRMSYRIPIGAGITGLAAVERKPILANNAHLDPRAIRIPGTRKSARCVMAAPLLSHGELWGCMTVVRLSDDSFSAHDMELLGILANQVADAAVNSSLFSRLSESEEKYRSFVEQATDAIFIIQDYKVVFANLAAEELLGYSRTELRSVELSELFPAEFRVEAEASYRRHVSGETAPQIRETRLLTKNQEAIDVEVNSGMIHYQSEPAYLVFARDIRERKRAEKALRESEERFRTLQANVSVGVFRVDPQGKMLSVNPAMVRILKYESEEELLSNPVLERHLDEKKRDELAAVLEREGSVTDFESELSLRNDSRVWVSLSMKAVTDEQGRLMHYDGSAADITQRKQAEEALRASWEFSRTVIERFPLGISVRSPSGQLLSANEAWMRIWGHSKDDLAAMMKSRKELKFDKTDSYLVEWLPQVKRIYERGGYLYIPEVATLTKKPQAARWVSHHYYTIKDITGKVERVVILTEDITERKVAEQALRESEERYRNLFHNATDAVYVEDLEGKILAVNHRLCEWFGYTEAELLKKRSRDLVPPDFATPGDELIGKLRKEGGFVMEQMALRRDGSTFPTEVSGRLIPWGETEAILVFVHDITEYKLVEDALREGERFLASVFASIQDGVSILDKNMNIIRVNSAMERWYPHSMPLVGKKCHQVYHGLNKPCEACPTLRTMKTGEAAYEVVEKRGLNGEVTGWLELYSFPLLDVTTGEMQGIIEYARDITDRKLAEDALRESQRVLSTLMSNLPGMAYRCRNDRNWTMEFVSEGSLELTGYQPSDLIENKKVAYGELIYPDDREMVWSEIQSSIKEKTPFQILYRIITASGEEKWLWEKGRGVFSEQGKLLALEGFIADITDRKRTEEALSDSEERYRNLFQNANDAIFVETLEGKILAVNRRACEWHGYAEEELLGMTAADIVPAEIRQGFPALQEALGKSGSFLVEGVALRKDGTTFTTEVSGRLIPWGTGEAVLVFLRDTTERKQAEDALKESEEKYRSLVERATDGICIIQNERLIFVNSHLAQMLGYTVDEIVGTPFSRHIAPERLEEVLQRYKARMEGMEVPSIYGTVVLRKGGGRLEVELNAGIITFHGDVADLVFVRDITERKRAEEALREREERYRTLVNTAQEGISLVDEKENILFVNPKMAELLGYTPEELTGMNLSQIVVPEEFDNIRSQTKIRKRGETSRYESTLLTKDGTERRVLVNAAPVFDGEGKFYATMGILTDITDIKNTEEELRLRLAYQTAQAQVMNRAISLDELDRFIDDCLGILGRASGAGRVYLATNHPDRSGYRVSHEWSQATITPLFDQDYSYETTPQIYQRLAADSIVSVLVGEMPRIEAKIFVERSALSILLTPIHLRSGFYGFIGMEECIRERVWAEIEIEAFRTTVRLIGTVIDRYFEEQERRTAEEALAESEQRYRSLVETSSDIIFLLSQDAKPLYISPATNRLGYRPEVILANPQRISEILPADEIMTIQAVFQKSLRDEHPVHDLDFEVYDTSGKSHWFSASWNWIRDEHGAIIAVQGVARDISERKESEQALRLRMEYEKSLFEISSLFLAGGITDSTLLEFLERLGRVTEVSRVYLLGLAEDEEGEYLKRSLSWVSEENPELAKDSDEDFFRGKRFARWLEKLSTGDEIRGLVDELPRTESQKLASQGIVSILVLPVFVEGRFWGAIGFDEVLRKRVWNVEDIRLLWTASQIFSSALATQTKSEQLARSYEELRERERRIRELNLKLVEAEEDERRRIARVLHDEIAQQLTGVSLVLSSSEFNRANEVTERLDEAKHMVQETQKFIRDLSYELRPPALDNLGLGAAVRAMARSVSEGTGVAFVIEGEDAVPRAHPDLEIMLYRIIQEAVTNSLKHALPEEIIIRLEYEEPMLRVSVVDDGKGFDVDKVFRESLGIGLRSIRERVSLIGGNFEVRSTPGVGTELSVEVEIKNNSDKIKLEE